MKARFLSLALVAIAGFVGQAALAGDCCGNNACCENACDCAPSCCADALCDDCCCDPCCRSEGLVGGAEVVWLQYFNSGGTGFNFGGLAVAAPAALGLAGATTVLDFPVDPDYEATTRFWVGWQNCDGLGVRVRYWEYDHDNTGTTATPAGTLIFGLTTGIASTGNVFQNVDTQVLDVEVFDSSELGCNWDATYSFGVRWTEYVEERGIQGLTGALPFSISFLKDFDGIGLTGALELRRPISDNLRLFANGRVSVLMGDETNRIDVTVDGIVASFTQVQNNDIKAIYETQMGVEYDRPMDGGATGFARGGVEVQYWDNFGTSQNVLFGDETAGFAGFFVTLGVSR